MSIVPQAAYNEFAITLPKPATDVVEKLVAKNILGGVPAVRLFPGEKALDNVLLIATTETNSEGDRTSLSPP